MNVKQTLKNLHKKFPTMSLDNLFEILDCYVEESYFSTYPTTEHKIWFYNENSTNEAANGNTTITTNFSSKQFTASH